MHGGTSSGNLSPLPIPELHPLSCEADCGAEVPAKPPLPLSLLEEERCFDVPSPSPLSSGCRASSFAS